MDELADEASCELRFEMSISRAEFLFRLPAAVGGDVFGDDDGVLMHRGDGRSWTVVLEPLPELSIALLRLERHLVTLRFDGYDDAERERFLRRFRLHFQRGGG